MAVAADEAVAGKMFAAGFHAAAVQAALQCQRQFNHHVRIFVEAAVADNGAISPVQIQYRCKRQIDAAGGQFGSQHPTDRFRPFFGGFRPLSVPHFAQYAHGGQAGKTRDKPLHAAAFVIDGHNQGRLAQGFDFLHEQGQLFSILEISAEQNHAADSGIKQAFFFFVGESEGFDIGHHGAARQGFRHHGFQSMKDFSDGLEAV